LARNYFHISKNGNWTEEQTNVPYLSADDNQLIAEAGYSEYEWEEELKSIKKTLLNYREQRIRPGLDHKQLVTWNALMIKGLVDAYRTFRNDHYLNLAKQTAEFIWTKCHENDILLHQPADSNRSIPGFLDDYAFSTESFISLYEATFDETWINRAKTLTEQAINLLYDKDERTFFYTSANGEELIARKSEIMDNVIPGSVSTMVRQLYKLGILFDEEQYTLIADQVFANVFPNIKSYRSAYSNWTIQILQLHYGIWEIALTGADASDWREELDQYCIPNKVTLGGTKSTLPLLEHKAGMESKAYLCQNKTCSLPQTSIAQIIELINNKQG